MTVGCRPQVDAGFTLIEALVVVALLGLMSMFMAGGLRTALVAWPRMASIDVETEELEAVSFQLRSLLSQVRPILTGDNGHEILRFQGTSTQLDFLAPLARRFGPADIVKYSLRYQDGQSLQLGWLLDRDNNLKFAAEDAGQGTEMLAGLTMASFQFLGCGRDQGGLDWRDAWLDEQTLPRLIRVQFVWRTRRVNIIIAPRIEAASGFSELMEPACSS